MQIGTKGPLTKDMKRSTLGVRKSREKSQEAEDKLGGQAEISFSSP